MKYVFLNHSTKWERYGMKGNKNNSGIAAQVLKLYKIDTHR